MSDFKINFNAPVKVRLTEFGIGIMRQKHDELNHQIKKHGGKGLNDFKVKIDDDGYTSFQIWQLMNTFGEYMHMGFETPFHSEMIFCDAKKVDE